MPPIHVMHLITDLDVGGAEMMLSRLVAAADPRRCRMSVVSMMEPGTVGAEIAAAGIAVHSLGMRRAVPDPRGVLRLVRLLRREQVDVLQTWLYHADLLGLFAARLAGVRRLAWNLRCSDMDFARYSRLSAALPRILARLSRLPDVVLVNSAAGKAVHERLGYRPRRWEIIPNGIDVDRFRPDPEAKARLCAELGIPPDGFLICLPARVDPMKDHATFLAAAERFGRTHPDARFILVGRGAQEGNESLSFLLRKTSHADRVTLMGERRDMPAVLAGMSVVTLSSAFGEGFPNVLAEAMACGVPVVSTDVGDAASIVDDAGMIIPPGNAEAMAAAWQRCYELGHSERLEVGSRARRRIISHYALQATAARYEFIYQGLAGPAKRS